MRAQCVTLRWDNMKFQIQVCALHCFHGFGANTWSWSRVQQLLADRLAGVVTAHDMPGFGLTQRCAVWVLVQGYALLLMHGRVFRHRV